MDVLAQKVLQALAHGPCIAMSIECLTVGNGSSTLYTPIVVSFFFPSQVLENIIHSKDYIYIFHPLEYGRPYVSNFETLHFNFFSIL